VARRETTTVAAADPARGVAGGAASYFVQSLERGIAVMRVFDRDRPEITRSDAAEATGLSRAAARRFLLTLADLSYVRSDGRSFRLTPGVLRLGYAYLSSHPLVQMSQTHCEALALGARETACVWVLDRDDTVCVVHVPAARIMTVSVSVGTRSAARPTAAGQVLLAGQADRPGDGGAGWVIADDDPGQGIRTIAVPVRDRTGRCIAAVGLCVHADRASAAALRRDLLTPLTETARRIEADLSAQPASAGRRGGSQLPADPEAASGVVAAPLAKGIAAHPGSPSGAHFIQSLERGLTVIRAFIGGPPQLTLSQVSQATGLTRAAARRFLLTLRDLGYIQAEARQFELTARVLELGHAYLSGLSLTEVAEPRLEQFVADMGESSSVAILDGYAVVYLTRVAASRVGALSISVGTRLPAWVTAMGRVLLAELPPAALDSHLAGLELRRMARRTLTDKAQLRQEIERARGQGWALVDGELEDGLLALAVPVRNRNGDVVAAVSVSAAAASDLAEAMRLRLLPPLLETASLIEADLRVAGSSSAHRLAAPGWRAGETGTQWQPYPVGPDGAPAANGERS
jgi:IclR family pca regulon transcriptional regulator